MRYVRLGQTDLKVSALAFGTWAFGGDWGAADRHDSDVAIGRALGPPPRRHVSAQERSAVIRTTINDHEGSAT